MTENQCVRCGRPAPDGYADVVCGVERPRAWLAEIADMVPAARDVAQRQARRGGGGGASGKPGSSLPIDLGATSRLDAVRNELATWVRHVAEERGVNRLEINGGGLAVAFRGSVWVDQVQGLTDDLGAMALWLADHCEWMRHRPEVDEFLTDVEACARVVRGIVDTQPERRLMGMCTCGKILYAPHRRSQITCPDCDTAWDVDEFRDVLRQQLDDRLVTAGEAAHLGGYLDTDRSVKQIRSLVDLWVRTERLAHHGEVLIKHKHRPGCESACVQAIDRIATYRFGDIGDLVASTPRRARGAEMGATS